MIVRCRVCKELILPPLFVENDTEFMALIADCTRHSAERHPELFAQVSAIAGQVIASLTLELFETKHPEVAKCSAGLRDLAVNAVALSRYSELKGMFELREPETKRDTVTENVTLLPQKSLRRKWPNPKRPINTGVPDV